MRKSTKWQIWSAFFISLLPLAGIWFGIPSEEAIRGYRIISVSALFAIGILGFFVSMLCPWKSRRNLRIAGCFSLLAISASYIYDFLVWYLPLTAEEFDLSFLATQVQPAFYFGVAFSLLMAAFFFWRTKPMWRL